LTGQKPDSFTRLYKQFSREFLTPLFEKLPKDDQVNRTIQNVVKKQSALLPDREPDFDLE
jgi:hypothetical protein